MKSIHTLIPDIQELLRNKDDWFTEFLSREFSENLGQRLRTQYGRGSNTSPRLRISGLGDKCPRALWHSIHTPEQAEPLPAWAELKFCYGHILEELAIHLAKAAGHQVEGEQDELVVDGIVGHRDCVIDGCVVDVKSLTSRGLAKLKDKTIEQDDAFGYLYQLDGYLLGSVLDPLVLVKDKGYILGIDKTLGHMYTHEHHLREDRIRERIRSFKDIVALGGPPPCTCETISDGKSGNIRLGVKASYSSFKYSCWPQLRTFLYSDGPHYLTRVVRKPDVPEVDKYGNYIS